MKIPTYRQAVENIELGVATPLERFVYEYEPMETRDADIWRGELAELVGYVLVHAGEAKECCQGDCGCDGQLELPLDTEPE